MRDGALRLRPRLGLRSGRQRNVVSGIAVGKTELLRAFDEIQFGPGRTLNLRDSFPTGPDAKFRADAWLRQRHSLSGDPVLIVTGRGKGSADGVPVVKMAVLALLHTLRRQGVVRSWQEHSQGSIVVEMATMTDLLTAPARHRDSKRAKKQPSSAVADSPAFSGLEPETVKLLRRLAERTIDDLGVRDAESLVQSEMTHKLSMLVRGLPETGDRESALRAAISRAIEELDARKYG